MQEQCSINYDYALFELQKTLREHHKNLPIDIRNSIETTAAAILWTLEKINVSNDTLDEHDQEFMRQIHAHFSDAFALIKYWPIRSVPTDIPTPSASEIAEFDVMLQKC